MRNTTDKNYLVEIKGYYSFFDEKCIKNVGEDYLKRIHPFDKGVRAQLDTIKLSKDTEFEIFEYLPQIKELWKILIEKSIICLRYYDTREPFMPKDGKTTNKEPYAYGVTDLKSYFDKYAEFEDVLYGGASYYRDHVVHVFRVWLLGIRQLLFNNCEYLERIRIEKGYQANYLEKLSVWTIIALTHDLGYPLQKSFEIVDKTRVMMRSFVDNPIVMMDLSFSGVQNSMNDFVLRFISSKMRELDTTTGLLKELTTIDGTDDDIIIPDSELKKKRYVARLQSKYYFKFQKSLENNQHGILSALIIYKLLLYFLESDYNINEDYVFSHEDTRQFYLRREILRSIASHTCKDIYQLELNSFSFLLQLCDDAQEWGRKCISELYIDSPIEYDFDGITISFLSPGTNKVVIKETYDIPDLQLVRNVLIGFFKQCTRYRDVFRDGQETNLRNFDLEKCNIFKIQNGANKDTYKIKLIISTRSRTQITITRDDGVIKDNDSFFSSVNQSFKQYFGDKIDDYLISRKIKKVYKSITFKLP